MAKTYKALSTSSQEVTDFIRSLGVEPGVTTRVVVDINIDDPIVRVYAEMIASDKTLEIITGLDLDVRILE